mgnify:CR=1 FL=1
MPKILSVFVLSPWSDCSTTCSIGIKTREEKCRKIDTDEVVANSECSGTPIDESDACLVEECPSKEHF